MGKVKISWKFANDRPPKDPERCRDCGRKLKSKISIQRGYGPRCIKAHPVMIILEITPDEIKDMLDSAG